MTEEQLRMSQVENQSLPAGYEVALLRAEVERLRAALADKNGRLVTFHACAAVADWGQVVRNGGPPCFYIEDGRFCLRAHWWDGHQYFHKAATLADAILWVQTGKWTPVSAARAALGAEK